MPERWKGIDLTSISDSEIEELVEDIYCAKCNINLPFPLQSKDIAKIINEFHCRRCGDCCIGGLEGIYLHPKDVEQLATAMKMSKKQFKDKLT